MTRNINLNQARADKNDEFYTQLSDVENELKHYASHFKNKVVYCNCDDVYTSNFFKYFYNNFKPLGLKKLITTCYQTENAVYSEYTGNNKEIKIKHLQGNGNFRNPENIEFLKEADVIVTNPPFSLFREYIAQLMEYDKQFLIVGSLNAITYGEFFPFLQNNKVWQGISEVKWFQVPNDYEIKNKSNQKIVDGKKYFKMGNIVWFTNLETLKRKEELILHKKYTPANYPKFDNFQAVINVNKVKDIPADYMGVMGVPITFLDKHNPAQFEILGLADTNNNSGFKTKKYTFEDDPNWKNLNKGGPVLKIENKLKSIYHRILIQRK